MYAFRVTDETEISAAFAGGRLTVPDWASLAATRPYPSYTQQAARPRGGAMLASALAVGALFSAMIWMNVAPHLQRQHHITTVDMALTPPPSAPEQPAPQADAKPASAPTPQQATAAPAQPAQPMAAALPVAQEQAPAAPVAPPAPVAAAAPVVAAPKAPAGPAELGDLSARLLSFSPPSYPLESRRLREEGAVVLGLVLGTDGRVIDIAVTSSSGSPRLDKAALEAVRKWRWAPLMRGGEPVQVRGHLKIPFFLKS